MNPHQLRWALVVSSISLAQCLPCSKSTQNTQIWVGLSTKSEFMKKNKNKNKKAYSDDLDFLKKLSTNILNYDPIDL